MIKIRSDFPGVKGLDIELVSLAKQIDEALNSLEIVSSGGLDKIIYKTADESVVNSTTLQEDNDLTVDLEANKKYAIEYVLYYDAATDGRLKIGAATSGTIIGGKTGGIRLTFDAGASNGDLKADSTVQIPSIPTAAMNAGGAGNADLVAVFKQFVETGDVAPTITLTWAQNNSNATPTRVFKYSYMHVKEVVE